MLFKREIGIRLCDLEQALDYLVNKVEKLERKIKKLEPKKEVKKKG